MINLPKVAPIIKPVSARCNISCDYCYYKKSHNSKSNGWKMSDVVLECMISQVIELAAKMRTTAEFTWHGGEPTLAGLDFYKSAIFFQNNSIKSKNIAFSNNIQTNGTLLNESWVAFLAEHNFSIGISLDGPEWIHDHHRFYRSGKGSFEKIFRNIELLKQYNVNFGVIGVVTRDGIGRIEEIIDFFVANGIYQFDLTPCAELPGTSEESYTLTPDQYADYMIRAFDHWIAMDNPNIEFRFPKQALYGIMGSQPGLCSMGNRYCGVFPTILPNGNVFFCDNYEGSEDMCVGNLMEKTLEEIVSSGTRHQVIREQIITAKQECSNCEWFSICGGGCPRYNRDAVGEQFTKNNYFCSAYKRIFSHISEKVTPTINILRG